MTSADNVTSPDLTTPEPDVTTQPVDVTTSPYDTTPNVVICKDGKECINNCANDTNIRILNVWFGRLKTYAKCVPYVNGSTHEKCYSSKIAKQVLTYFTCCTDEKL